MQALTSPRPLREGSTQALSACSSTRLVATSRARALLPGWGPVPARTGCPHPAAEGPPRGGGCLLGSAVSHLQAGPRSPGRPSRLLAPGRTHSQPSTPHRAPPGETGRSRVWRGASRLSPQQAEGTARVPERSQSWRSAWLFPGHGCAGVRRTLPQGTGTAKQLYNSARKQATGYLGFLWQFRNTSWKHLPLVCLKRVSFYTVFTFQEMKKGHDASTDWV